MELLGAYLSMDRRQALALGETLPDRTQGAALFADISGFTPLTEALVGALGPQRGAEELTNHLNRVFDALIAELHRYGGSVIGFAGDAITCWLDGDDGLKAATCALAMQQVMQRFAAVKIPSGQTISLAMKVAVATGPARRFVVGDPQVQLIDVLAGSTLDRLEQAADVAERGDVVLDPAAVSSLGDRVQLAAWSRDEATGERFGILGAVTSPVTPSPWSSISPDADRRTQLRPWLLPPVFDLLQAGRGEFLAELRPAVALFLRFTGIDYDGDENAGVKLDAFVRWVQAVLAGYDAYMLHLTMGDKGSYLGAAFGAPTAHEDDTVRALSAALELLALPSDLGYIEQVQIGISQGRLWTGAYGGLARRTYGVMGDDVNLAARLMQAADAGEILVSRAVRQRASDDFIWQDLPALKLKGITGLVPVYTPRAQRRRRAIGLQETAYALPMVGREDELALIQDKLDLVMQGDGQIIGITGDAGIGKTRLMTEAIRLVGEREIPGFASECESYGTNTSYLVWRPIWRAFFGIDPSWELADQLSVVEGQLEQIDSTLVPRMPLLGTALNLSIPDNDLTRTFDAELRKSSLEALLIDCLRAWAGTTPLLLVLEDCHWLDPLSHDLLEVLGRAAADLPVLMLMAYRPPEVPRLQAPRVSRLAHFSEIHLSDFTPQEAQRLITLKLKQLAGPETAVSPTLVERITARAEGNPFYIEELLNYLSDRGIDPTDNASLERLDLPSSLHSLIISRLDQRTESQKTTLRVASVIGRLFRAALLWGMYPEIGTPDRVKTDLNLLCSFDLTRVDTPEPELSYLFKHIVTQEVAYESLPYATRAMLHEHLARYIETSYTEPLQQYVDLLAYHYERSENDDKKREYLLKAGEAAQADYANEAAIDYYQRLLPLLSPAEQVPIMLKLGEVLQLVGRWDEVDELCQRGLALAEQLGDPHALARCQTAKGELLRRQGLYAEASEWLERARFGFDELGDRAGVGQVLHYFGIMAAQQGDLDAARNIWSESLTIREELDDKPSISALLSNLGLIAHWQGDYELAQALHEGALMLREELGDKWAIAVSLNNLGYLAIEQGDYESARTQLEEAVSIQREIGDRAKLADAVTNLGIVARDQGTYAEARTWCEEALTINEQLGNSYGIAYVLEEMAGLAALQGQMERAFRLSGAAGMLRKTIGAPLPPAEKARLERMLEPAMQELGDSAAAAAAAEGDVMSMEQAIAYAYEVD